MSDPWHEDDEHVSSSYVPPLPQREPIEDSELDAFMDDKTYETISRYERYRREYKPPAKETDA